MTNRYTSRPTPTRDIVVDLLRQLDGMTVPEIAAELDRNINTIRTVIRVAHLVYTLGPGSDARKPKVDPIQNRLVINARYRDNNRAIINARFRVMRGSTTVNPFAGLLAK